MDSNVQLTTMANVFDELAFECSPETNQALQRLAEWVAENVLTKGGGVLSAKELILQTLIVEDKTNRGYRWNKEKSTWQKSSSTTA